MVMIENTIKWKNMPVISDTIGFAKQATVAPVFLWAIAELGQTLAQTSGCLDILLVLFRLTSAFAFM